MGSDFVLDDGPNIEAAKAERFTTKNLAQIVASNQSGVHPLSRAIPTISFTLSYLQYGDDPAGFKQHNLLLHLLCGVFVFVFIFKLSTLFQINNEQSLFIALTTSSIWLLHPLLVSTTLYSVQRITQFSTLFTLLALSTSLYARLSGNKHTKVLLYFIAFPLFFVMGALSKETAFLTPLYIIAIGLATRNVTSKLESFKIDKLFFYSMGVIPVIIGLSGFLLKFDKFINYSYRDFNVIERLLTQVHILTGNLKNIFLPDLSTMGLFLDDTPIQESLDVLTLFKITLLFAFTVWCLFLIYKRNFLSVAILFILGHLLESSIIPLELAFEHRNYFPSIGIFAAISFGICQLRQKHLRVFFALFLILLYSFILNIRVGFWSNEHEWQKTSLTFHPTSVRSNISYVNYLLKHFGHAAALDHIRKTNDLIPNSLALKTIELTYLCGGEKDNINESAQIINEIESLLTQQVTSPAETNLFLQLSKKISITRCENIDNTRLFNVVHNKINTLEEKNSPVGNLYAVRGLLLFSAGLNQDASENFKLAFFTTGKVGYMITATKILLSKQETFDEGVEIVKNINQGKYFSISLYPVLIENLNKAVEDTRKQNAEKPANYKN